MLERDVIFRNPELKHTSSWANTFLGRDHAAAAVPAEKKDEQAAARASGPEKS